MCGATPSGAGLFVRHRDRLRVTLAQNSLNAAPVYCIRGVGAVKPHPQVVSAATFCTLRLCLTRSHVSDAAAMSPAPKRGNRLIDVGSLEPARAEGASIVTTG